MTDNHYDTIIIGAGFSGLAAGARLAYFGKKVCILEKHTTIGGLNSFYKLRGRIYDSGLHAVTNYLKDMSKGGAMRRILRQLRVTPEEFGLMPQKQSLIQFPGSRLRFANEFEFFVSEIEREFPHELENFIRLSENISRYDQLDFDKASTSAMEFVKGYLSDPLLIDMLFCPLMFYGNAREGDMDYAQFCILFQSIFREGLSRPTGGIKALLKAVTTRFKKSGGELRLRAGVQKILVSNDKVAGVQLDDGTELTTDNLVSSAGWYETMELCGVPTAKEKANFGSLSFVESISVLNCQPEEIGFSETTVFYSQQKSFGWKKPDGFVDTSSGVICSPNNFECDQETEGMIRVTSLANFDKWNDLPEEEYRLEKLNWYDKVLDSAAKEIPDFRGKIVDYDFFTPVTVKRFTGHKNGAIYGSPDKKYDGRTDFENLYICGTDQGLVGIIGAITGGLLIANSYLLK